MNLHWPMFGQGSQGWTGYDAAANGTFVAARVRTGHHSSVKPRVISCAESSRVANGVHAIEELAHKLGGPGYPCTLALSRGDYQMLVVPEPPVLEAEMESSLRWSLGSLVDFPVNEANVAWIRIPTAAYVPSREKQVYAIVAKQSVLDEQTAFFGRKVPLKAIDVRETALRNIAGLLEKKGEGIGLVSVSETGISTIFTFRGELYLDRFIAQPMDEIMAGDVERQQKFLERVAQQVYQSMELITRTFPFIAVEGIVVAPSPVALPLAECLSGKLPVPVRSLDLGAVFDLTAVPQLSKPANQARYLVALGAALRGMRRVA